MNRLPIRFGVDGARGDRVDQDIVAEHLFGERRGEGPYRSLGHRVGRVVAGAGKSAARTDRDYTAIAVALHRRHRRAAAQKRRLEIEVEHRLPFGERGLGDRFAAPESADQVDQDVELAEAV